jgi:hypothetical protein
MSTFTNPKIAAIDDALTELEPSLDEFARCQGFTLARSHDGSFNVPHRWLHRDSAGIRHTIGLIIALPMLERMERGFFPEIPCTLYITASDRTSQKYYDTRIFEEQPFHSVKVSLSHHLAEALVKLDACTADFILHHGVRYNFP